MKISPTSPTALTVVIVFVILLASPNTSHGENDSFTISHRLSLADEEGGKEQPQGDYGTGGETIGGGEVEDHEWGREEHGEHAHYGFGEERGKHEHGDHSGWGRGGGGYEHRYWGDGRGEHEHGDMNGMHGYGGWREHGGREYGGIGEWHPGPRGEGMGIPGLPHGEGMGTPEPPRGNFIGRGRVFDRRKGPESSTEDSFFIIASFVLGTVFGFIVWGPTLAVFLYFKYYKIVDSLTTTSKKNKGYEAVADGIEMNQSQVV